MNWSRYSIRIMLLLVLVQGVSPAHTRAQGGPAPFDLVWDTSDDNGLPLNPKWGAQVTAPGSLPDHAKCSGGKPYLFPCTTQITSTDSGLLCLRPHANWFTVTYHGTIYWNSHSAPGTDDDYNVDLVTPGNAGCTTTNPKSIHCEFDSDETIDHFHTPWWNSFHKAVDDSDTKARAMIDGREAIVTGLMGLDCEHSCGSESHPVYALAIKVKDDVEDTVWAIFVRNWGDEGFCGSQNHKVSFPKNNYTFRLPWLAGAGSVTATGTTRFLGNSNQITGPSVTAAPEGVLVSFHLPDPSSGGRVNGELHLRWVLLPRTNRVSPPRPVSRPENLSEAEEGAEGRISEMVKKMTPPQRATYLAKLPKNATYFDDVAPLMAREVKTLPHLPQLVKSRDVPPTRSETDRGRLEKAHARLRALTEAFDGRLPEDFFTDHGHQR